jgi:plastocyanin
LLNTTGLASCISCPGGGASAIGSATCIQCPIGTATNGGATCVNCAIGTYNDRIGSIACTQCPGGTANNVLSATSLRACLTCPSGKFAGAGSSVCAPCSVGTFSSSTGPVTAASFQTSFNVVASYPNYIIDGVVNPTLNLVVGVTYRFTLTVADNSAHPFEIRSGLTSIGVNDPNGTTFTPTAAGTFAFICRYHPEMTGQVIVSNPLPGTPGATLCTPCAVGFYADQTSSASCTACPAGSYTLAKGAVSVAACVPCPAGTYSLGVRVNVHRAQWEHFQPSLGLRHLIRAKTVMLVPSMLYLGKRSVQVVLRAPITR